MSGILELLRSAPVLPRQYRLAISALRNDSSITIFPADKGSRIVVLDTAAYIQAAEDMLSDRRVYKKLRAQAPLTTRIQDYNQELEDLQDTLPRDQNGNKSTLLNKFIIKEPSGARTAYAYFTPKDHKPHPPLEFRPIIAQCGAYTTPLAKYVAGILSPMVGSFSGAHLSNSQDFISSLSSFYTNNPHYLSAPLVSLDVSSLFTNVPVDIVLSFLHTKIVDNDIQLPVGLTLDVLIQLIKLCCNATLFSFNNNFYTQLFGVAMGSPLACILANLFMEFF